VAKKQLVLVVGYRKFLMDREDAIQVAALLTDAKVVDTETTYSRITQRSYSAYHWGSEIAVTFERAPEMRDIHADSQDAATVINAQRSAAEALKIAADQEKEEQERIHAAQERIHETQERIQEALVVEAEKMFEEA